MQPGNSSLNPYAASYIPLSKRVETGDGTSWSGAPSENQQVTKQNKVQGEASLDFSVHGIEKLLDSEDGTPKGTHDSWSENLNGKTEKQGTQEDSEIDLAFLSAMFPGISDQSLADVYSVNEGDLDASVDMLHQLEVYPADVSQCLPDSLDVGDVSGIEYPAEGTSVRPNQTIPGEASGSVSCSLESAS